MIQQTRDAEQAAERAANMRLQSATAQLQQSPSCQARVTNVEEKNRTDGSTAVTDTRACDSALRADILNETAQLTRLHAQVERELVLTSQAEQKMTRRSASNNSAFLETEST